MDASILVLCANRQFTGVTVTFYRCFGRFTGFRDGQGVHVRLDYKRTKRPSCPEQFFVENLFPLSLILEELVVSNNQRNMH